MFLLYSLLFTLGVIVTAPYYLRRLRGRIASLADWRERFGFLPRKFQQEARGAIWVHAVSVGETRAVAGLVRELARRFPETRIFMSHVTPAGREVGEALLPDVAGQFFLPLDWRASVTRSLKRIRPALLVIVETELWPNLLRAAHESGSRVVIVNARISDRSFRRYALVRPLMRRVLEYVDAVFPQSATDADRFRALGALAERVSVSGNLKFDARPPERGEFVAQLVRALARARRGPVLVAASTMRGEEQRIVRSWAEVRRRYAHALLILAPRHPARFDSVAQLLSDRNVSWVRRSALETSDDGLARQLESPEILLLDTIGELAGMFALADVVVMGGTFVPTGGHNLLEPAFWSKPILFGTHMENFRDVAQLFLEARAALQVSSAGELGGKILELLEDADARRRLGEAAKRILEREAGATARVLSHLEEWLGANVPAPAGA